MMVSVCAVLQTHMHQMCYEIEQYRTTCEIVFIEIIIYESKYEFFQKENKMYTYGPAVIFNK